MTAIRIIAVLYRLFGAVLGFFSAVGVYFSLPGQPTNSFGAFSLSISFFVFMAALSCFAFAEMIDYLFALQENFDRLITQTHAAETRLRTLIALNERMAVSAERTAAAVEILSQSVNRNRPQ